MLATRFADYTNFLLPIRRAPKINKQVSVCFVMHFSAGVGRSGTFIAFSNLAEEAKVNQKVNVMQEVIKMRMNRKDMVQNVVSC